MKTLDLINMIEEVKDILSRPLINSSDIAKAKQKLTEIQTIESHLADLQNESELNSFESTLGQAE
jgi:hypothetical protein